MSNFTFGYNVFKSRLLLLRHNATAGGKELMEKNMCEDIRFPSFFTVHRSMHEGNTVSRESFKISKYVKVGYWIKQL